MTNSIANKLEVVVSHAIKVDRLKTEIKEICTQADVTKAIEDAIKEWIRIHNGCQHENLEYNIDNDGHIIGFGWSDNKPNDDHFNIPMEFVINRNRR